MGVTSFNPRREAAELLEKKKKEQERFFNKLCIKGVPCCFFCGKEATDVAIKEDGAVVPFCTECIGNPKLFGWIKSVRKIEYLESHRHT